MKSADGSQKLDSVVLVCFAVKEEAKDFQHAIAPQKNVSVLITGMGRRNSEQSLLKFLDQQTTNLVLTCGFAGALDPQLKIGDVLFEADSETNLNEALHSQNARPGKFYGADRVAVTVAEKAELRRTIGADAVEMESSVIRKICRERGIPSATVRVISDTAGENLPLDFNTLMTAEQKISLNKLIAKLVSSPGSVPGLLQLQRNTKFAAQQLAKVLMGLLRSL